MNSVVMFSIVSFFLIAIISGVYSSLLVRGKQNDKTPESQQESNQLIWNTYSTEQLLSMLSEKIDPEKCAEIVGQLVQNGYILSHILRNRGNCYNDNIQPEIYRKSLTNGCVKRLFELGEQNRTEENDGGYFF